VHLDQAPVVNPITYRPRLLDDTTVVPSSTHIGNECVSRRPGEAGSLLGLAPSRLLCRWIFPVHSWPFSDFPGGSVDTTALRHVETGWQPPEVGAALVQVGERGWVR